VSPYITSCSILTDSHLLHVAVHDGDTFVSLDEATQSFFRLPRKVRFFSGRVVSLPDGRAYLDTETFAKVWPRSRAKLRALTNVTREALTKPGSRIAVGFGAATHKTMKERTC